MSKSFQIAIDGPVAAGCSTVARLVAARLGILYVDTGAMYRAAALLAMSNQVDLNDGPKIAKLIEKSQLELMTPTQDQGDGRLITVILDGEDVSWKIRTDEVSKNSALVAKHVAVRQILVKKQQAIAAKNDVVMEGRDITYKVLPQADLKFFLTASEVVRARRYHIQEQSKGRNLTFEQASAELSDRDEHDMKRQLDPLKIVEDAVVIDTSDLMIEQVAEMIEAQAKAYRDVNSS